MPDSKRKPSVKKTPKGPLSITDAVRLEIELRQLRAAVEFLATHAGFSLDELRERMERC